MALAPMNDPSLFNRQAMLSQMAGGTAGDAASPPPGGASAAPPVDLGENSPEAIAKLNADHPEYSGGEALGPPAAPAAAAYNTKLMEGDPSKFTPEHMAKSPKYDFLNLARSNKYDYTQMGDMLKELQGGPNARLWQGWTADGKGNLVFNGDPSQLAKEWEGVKNVDAVGAYGNLAQGKEAKGWRWGVDDPNASPSSLDAGGLQNGMTPGTGGDMSGGALQASLNQGVPTDNAFFQQLLERARGIAGPASTNREALLSQMKQQ